MLKTKSIETRVGRRRIIESTIDKSVKAAPLRADILATIRGEISADTANRDKGKAEEKDRKRKAADKKKVERKKAAAQKKESEKKSQKFLQRVFG